MMKKYTTLVWIMLLMAAQSATAQTTRSVQKLSVAPEIQAEFVLPNNDHLSDYLWFSLRGWRATSDGQNTPPPRALGFEEGRLAVGYEHFLTGAWSVGATLRGVEANKSFVVVPEVLLRHRSKVAGLMFGQRLSFERAIGSEGTYVYGGGPQGENWVRFRVDLEKQLPLGNRTLRPRLSYEAATHLRIEKSDADKDERTVQFTSLRGEVGIRLTDRFDLTPWFARQTTYYVTVQQFDGQGRPTSGTRLNIINPVLGLDVRFTLSGKGGNLVHQALPTQH